jgi:chromatin remodeling complex protein RSC6
MVRTTTATTPASATPAAAAPAAPADKSTKPRAKKAAVEVAAAPAPASVVVPAASVAAPAAEVVADASDPTVALAAKLSEFSAKLQQMVGLFSTVKNDFKTLEKAVSREMKVAQKASSKKRRNTGNRKPSGFIKPTRISDELAGFLGKSVGTEMARTEVSKEINAYIHAHSLQDKSNGRIIHADAKLSKLLKLQKEDELTYFNLQRYMKHHFHKGEVSA